MDVSRSTSSLPAQDSAAQATYVAALEKTLRQERAGRLKAERALRRTQAANSAKDRFLSILSHELRTTLNSILGWVVLLRAERLDPSTSARALEIIERNAATQSKLVNDLSDISRIIQGKLRLELQPVALQAVVRSALDTVMLAAQQKRIELVLQIAVDEGVQVLADRERLGQVVWNLLTNAIKFTPEGGRIEITLRSQGSEIELIVSDSGIGIVAEALPHLFELFHQSERAIHHNGSGLGLGLAIAREIIHLHGGQIRAESAGAGQGATFTVRLPLAQLPR
ncbi:sensor histidine kinase [Gloeobacter kilaueensis]|nr:HAMP domain-containing sensor histidine kinase [Gloeobacter kilaueensis]